MATALSKTSKENNQSVVVGLMPKYRTIACAITTAVTACTPQPPQPRPSVRPTASPSGPATMNGGSSLRQISGGLSAPNGMDVDHEGNLYVADAGTNSIVKITPKGAIATLAGGTKGFSDGVGPTAKFDKPFGIAVRNDGSLVVADSGNHRIRQVLRDGTVTTIAGTGNPGSTDGQLKDSEFNAPGGVAIDALNEILVADTGGHRVRLIGQNNVSTVAGSEPGYADGPLETARFDAPSDLAVDKFGHILIADSRNHAIRAIDIGERIVRTVAGKGTKGAVDGVAPIARFNLPTGLAIASDSTIYVADSGNLAIRKVAPDGSVSTLVSFPETGDSPTFQPNDIVIMPSGDIYVSDSTRHAVLALN